ncbi:unnamed protein product [Spirodela intermedia]|uniref:DEUBAD domain-containing protein n=1 Tax=Spirodela intermedia TaxID=51605 RepID=A0A7I8K6A9_SPIIN|nr:unnamed protein product [Spirodela intermedia]
MGRPKPSSVEKLTRDLHSILHQQASYISGSPEDELLYETETPWGSVEIGNGGVLIRHPNAAILEDESEASSLPIDNKLATASEAYSGASSLPVNSVGKEDPVDEKVKRTPPAEEHARRDKVPLEKFSMLRCKDSPLTYVDLTEIVNLEVFMRHLTSEEQQQLMKYLPSIDAARPPESLKSMFQSPQFTENMSYYRQLLADGTFDMNGSGVTADESRALKKLVLTSSLKSKWVEYHTKIKSSRNNEAKRRKGVRTGPGLLGSSSSVPLRRPNDRLSQNPPEKKSSIKSPKRSSKLRVTNLRSLKSPQPNSMENTLSIFSPRGMLASPLQVNPLLDSLQFDGEDSDQDLLLEVRTNGSFPEAELLSETWKQNAGLNSMSAESGIESISYNPTSSSSSQPLKRWD